MNQFSHEFYFVLCRISEKAIYFNNIFFLICFYFQDSSSIEKLMKLLDIGLRSPHLPSRIAAMHGILYLLEGGVQEITKTLVPIATDFLLRNLGSISQ